METIQFLESLSTLFNYICTWIILTYSSSFLWWITRPIERSRYSDISGGICGEFMLQNVLPAIAISPFATIGLGIQGMVPGTILMIPYALVFGVCK